MRPEFQAVPFEDRGKAEGNLARLEQQLAPTLMLPLASLLAQSPDPDGALNLLERYVQVASPQVLGELAQHPTALSYLIAIFSYSGFLAETLLAEPELVIQFARDRNFTKLKSKEDLMQDYARFATTNPDPWLASLLARFKRRNYLRIVLKDVLGLSTLGETTLELSTLTDVMLANTLLYCDRELEKRYGQPQYRDAQGRIARAGFSIISLGKLGGNELNYSSDIDLLFLYSHDGETAGGNESDSTSTNKEYFVRLAHAITRTITQTTPQGEVFRVDLRLRPEGDQGDLAISLKSALEYYEHRARDWELQMLIKARHSAGEARLTRDFLRGVEEYVYRSPGDFVAVESVLWAREKISKKMRESRGQAVDVKRHRGGIRDIEFLVQCLQRLHGLQDHWVRSGGTLFALRKLNDKGWLSDRDYARLTTAYEFLRGVEHRVQLELGQQTHRLPADSHALDRLARRVGLEATASESAGTVLLNRVRNAFARVDEIYEQVIHRSGSPVSGAAFELKPVPALLPDLGHHSLDATLQLLDAQAPDVAQLVREARVPERARRNVNRLLAALFASSERFALVRQKPQCLRRACEVIGASDYLADLLAHHPEDLAAFDSSAAASPADSAVGQLPIHLEAREGFDPHAWALEPGLGIRQKMAMLRRAYRAGVLELAATDLDAGGWAYTLLKRWSSMAARSVASALAIARGALGEEGGSEDPRKMPFVVLGLGRLGLNEFDLASDADLVFVAGPDVGREELSFWTALAAKTIEVLASYTRDGTLFAVDTRLRPRGQEGELVVTTNVLLAYMAESAHAWEAMTYLKALPVAGNLDLGSETVARIVSVVFDRFGGNHELHGELRQMRRRLEKEVLVPPSNMKTAPGGYYDVDFAVSTLRLQRRLITPPGSNMAEQIAALRAADLLSADDNDTLTAGAAFLRSVDHAIRLVTGRAVQGLPERLGHAEAAESLLRRWGVILSGETLALRLRETQENVRKVYRRVLEAE
jgi:glutamate-ammonia-ligase adenylyltransferase